MALVGPSFLYASSLSTAAGAEPAIKLILINAIFPDWQRMGLYCATAPNRTASIRGSTTNMSAADDLCTGAQTEEAGTELSRVMEYADRIAKYWKKSADIS